ncbi:carbohydrate ABC transporter permease [Thermoactinospora rubra]|uniref:carbohydrate ABC transporter permease n=1 Tax=Thermoactinospora rubra TaxID=1088767 RepID=UPI001F0AD15D|nr:sugar ABC transporter permease [Thermoactinospora rubra]
MSGRGKGRARGPGIRGREGLWGWLFMAPALVILGLFMVIPILLALWVSFRSWSGLESPFGPGSQPVGLDNYAELLVEPGLAQRDFARGLRNNLYYVLGVVPVQTAIAFFLALVLHQKVLRARGFFRSAFYFPSITSSVAVALVFMAIFQPNGVLNRTLEFFGLDGSVWLDDPRGLVHIVLGWFGVSEAPGFLQGRFMGLSWWDWLSGPSVTLTAIMAIAVWTTIGTFMLMFLAGLQNLPRDVDEAAVVDGANRWQLFWRITLPQMRPTLFLVLTLGIIGTWQVFDQIFVISDGGPQKTSLTPAYLVYVFGFETRQMGLACAVAFLLFLVIVLFTLLQRRLLRER